MRIVLLTSGALLATVFSFGQECPDLLPDTLSVCSGDLVELLVPSVNNDPFFSDVVFQTTGANGQIVDESCFQWSLGSNGTPALNPDALIGDHSIEFNSNEWVSTGLQNEMAVDGDFTIELWYKTDAGPINQHRHLLRYGNGNDFPNDNYVMITLYRSGLGAFGNKIGFQWKDDLFDAGVYTQGTWEHIALVREGNTWRFYRNGVQVLSEANNVNLNIPSRVFLPTSNSAYDGLIDGVRITNGVCRYPGGNSFTPPGASEYQTCNQSYSNIEWSTGETDESISILANQDSTIAVSFDTPLTSCTDTVRIMTNLPMPQLGSDSLTLCAGETGTLTPGDGFASFFWNGGTSTSSIEVTEPGIYWVDVSDELGCTNRDSITVLTLNDTILSSALTVCEGDSVLLSRSGSSSVLWGDGSSLPTIWVRPTADSTFTAVFSNNGAQCTDSLSIQVLPFQFSIDVSEPNCQGETGSIVIEETAGTITTFPETTFLQSVTAGNYPIRISNAQGCVSDTLISVIGPAPLIVLAEAISPTCTGGNNGRILLSASGGTGNLTANWFGVNPDQVLPGLYSVEITDEAGCSVVRSVEVPDEGHPCGCAYENADNYDPLAVLEDGSCTFNCFGDSNGDNHINSSDLLFFLSSFGSVCE